MSQSTPVSPEQMKTLLEISRKLTVTAELDPLLEGIATACTMLLRCERASIFLHDPLSNELVTRVALESLPIRIPISLGIAGHAFGHNAVVPVHDPYNDPRFNPEIDRTTGFRTRNLLAAPMVDIDHKPIGVLEALNKTDGPFTPADCEMIQLLADQAGVAMQRYNLQRDAVETTALRREMSLARKVQQRLLPSCAPNIPGFEACGWSQPALQVGGDCFDFWRLSDGRLGVFLADASGHGLAPALIVSQVRTLVRTLIEIEPDPTKLLLRINHRMSEDLEGGYFVTAFLGIIEPRGDLIWSSAGQQPILIRKSGQPPQPLDSCMPPLGIPVEFDPSPASHVNLAPGDSLVATSDGITEAFSPSSELYTIERVIETLRGRPALSPVQTIDLLKDAVLTWQQKPEPNDDQTIVVIRRTA